MKKSSRILLTEPNGGAIINAKVKFCSHFAWFSVGQNVPPS